MILLDKTIYKLVNTPKDSDLEMVDSSGDDFDRILYLLSKLKEGISRRR